MTAVRRSGSTLGQGRSDPGILLSRSGRLLLGRETFLPLPPNARWNHTTVDTLVSRLMFQIREEFLGVAGGDVFAAVWVGSVASHDEVWAVADGTVLGEGDGVDGIGGDGDVMDFAVWGLGFDGFVFAELDGVVWRVGFGFMSGDEVGGGDSFGGSGGVASGGVDGEEFGSFAGALGGFGVLVCHWGGIPTGLWGIGFGCILPHMGVFCQGCG